MSNYYELLSRLETVIAKYEGFMDAGEGDSLLSWLSTFLNDFRIAAAGRKGYATKALLDANLSYEDGTLAEVTSDSIPTNNGLYRKSEGAGLGSWVFAPYDQYTVLKDDVAAEISAIGRGVNQAISIALEDRESNAPYDISHLWSIIDADGNVLLGINEDGTLDYKVKDSEEQVSESVIPFDSMPDMEWGFVDENGQVLFGVDSNGFLISADRESQTVSVAEFGDDVESAITDENGEILIEIAKDGEVYSPKNIQMPMPYVKDSELRVVGTRDDLVAAMGASPILSTRMVTPKLAQVVLDKKGLGNSTRMAAEVGAGYLVPDDFKTLHVVIVNGQSLSVGSQGYPVLATQAPHPGDVLMFSGDETIDVRMGINTSHSYPMALDPLTLTGFTDLIAMETQAIGSGGQTVSESMGHELSKAARAAGVPWHGFFFNPGRGGTKYEDLKKGTLVYENFTKGLQRCKDLAEAQGLTIVVDAMVILHGEGDAGNQEYKSHLLEWQVDVDADVKAVTGQVADVPFLLSQPSSFYTPSPYAVQAMYELHSESEQHFLVTPNYDVEYSPDLVHLSALGYQHLGEKIHKFFIDKIWMDKPAGPLIPLSLACVGRNLDITYSVPSPPLVIDSVLINNPGDFGFSVLVDGSEVIIESVTLLSSDTVRIVLVDEPIGGSREVKYAMAGHAGDRSEAEKPRGNIRDSNEHKSAHDGADLFNWSVHFMESF